MAVKSVNLTVENFFKFYIFNTDAKELTPRARMQAKVGFLALIVFTLGLVPLCDYLFFYNRNFKRISSSTQSSPTVQKVEETVSTKKPLSESKSKSTSHTSSVSSSEEKGPKPNDLLLDFYRGKGVDSKGRTLADMWKFGDEKDGEKETCHDYIQWLFPTKRPSNFNTKHCPILNDHLIGKIRNDSQIQNNLKTSFDLMLAFYGLTFDGFQSKVSYAVDFADRVPRWFHEGNHNTLRITRILNSLNLLGLEKEAQVLYRKLELIGKDYPNKVGPATFKFWKDAARVKG